MTQRVSGFDYNKLRKEAQMRWLKPAEILYILQNHESYPITEQAVQKPPSGSLFLFNKRVLRYFRKDGHNWRKKKDGRNVGEAHERLKVGNVDALNCYYAHGEQNPYFQRRSYWILDPAYEHIVLVHYREVSEGRFLPASISNTSADSCSTFSQSTSASNANHLGRTSGISEQYDPNGCSCSPATVEEVSSQFAVAKSDADPAADGLRNSDLSLQPEFSLALHKLTVQLSLDDDDERTICFGEKFPAFNEHEKSQDFGLPNHETRESVNEAHANHFLGVEFWEHGQSEHGKQDVHSSTQSLNVSGDNRLQGWQSVNPHYNIQTTETSSLNHMLDFSSGSAALNGNGRTSNFITPPSVLESSTYLFGKASNLTPPGHGGNGVENRSTATHVSDTNLGLQLSATREFLLGPENPIESPGSIPQFSKIHLQETCGTNICETSSSTTKFRKQNSTDWMAAIDLDAPDNTYSSDLSTMWFDQEQFSIPLKDDSSLTVAETQRFSIREICPEWAFSFESTKVIVIGDFLCNPSGCTWAIMFGDIQVPAEVVQEGVLRCMAPQHGDGKVTLCVTSGNRESCSEVREFEFCAKPTTSSCMDTQPKADAMRNPEELLLLVRFVHMLLCGSDFLATSNGGMGTENALKTETRWSMFTEALLAGSEVPSETVGWMMQELLKDKLQQWLSSKMGKECLLSKQEQGIIHMISGLGYGWALNPILDSGVGINFRDANGWTALHWAARFGREKMVAALLAAGASAGAVTDPTSLDPVGKTAGAIASANGHLGLAGYLSEAGLTSHLSSLNVGENEISKGSTELEAERAVETISQRSVQMHVGGTEDELSLKDSLAAVRNATQAAARIQVAFRAHSFRKRQQVDAASPDEYGMTPEAMHGLSALSKFQRAVHQNFDKAALSIQKKYRGWKGRRDFLTLRQNVVKIQAHVRGYQERKKYKVFVSTVSVLEKVILRWRRKGVGLRGYRAEPEPLDNGDEEIEDIVKVFRKKKVDAAVDQAVSRVLSMVESPTSRQQYRRMLERYQQAEADLSASDQATSVRHDDFASIESDEIIY